MITTTTIDPAAFWWLTVGAVFVGGLGAGLLLLAAFWGLTELRRRDFKQTVAKLTVFPPDPPLKPSPAAAPAPAAPWPGRGPAAPFQHDHPAGRTCMSGCPAYGYRAPRPGGHRAPGRPTMRRPADESGALPAYTDPRPARPPWGPAPPTPAIFGDPFPVTPETGDNPQ